MVRRLFGGFALVVLVGAGLLLFPPLREFAAPWLPTAFGVAEPAGQKGPKRALRPIPVRIASAAARDVPIHLDGVGTVKARSTVAIKSRIEGQLFEALVREGQTVRRGDVLFRLDPRPLQARLKEIEAILGRDRANYEKAVADVARLKDLSAKGIAPKTRLDDARTLVDTFAATVRATEAEVELAKLNLDYATIRSPIDGRVGSLLITPGNIVKPSDTQPLLVITETKPVYVSFGIPEQHIDRLRERMRTERLKSEQLSVEVSTQASKDVAATGHLFFINNEVDTATGTIQLLAIFENADERLIPGQFARARILLSTLKDAVVVPSRSIQINQDGQYVWIVRTDNTIELRRITLGPEDGDDTVVREGLRAGENVVTDGQLRLFPDAVVEPESAGAAPEPKPLTTDGPIAAKG